MVYWSRDPYIPSRILDHQNVIDPATACAYLNRGMCDRKRKDDSAPDVPNGVVPFWGISAYAMPVCYLYVDAETAYLTFRELYTR